MKTKEARGLVKSIIVDLDGAIAGNPKDEMDRHSAAASAATLAARLLSGIAVNIARIAAALEDIADTLDPEDEGEET